MFGLIDAATWSRFIHSIFSFAGSFSVRSLGQFLIRAKRINDKPLGPILGRAKGNEDENEQIDVIRCDDGDGNRKPFTLGTGR